MSGAAWLPRHPFSTRWRAFRVCTPWSGAAYLAGLQAVAPSWSCGLYYSTPGLNSGRGARTSHASGTRTRPEQGLFDALILCDLTVSPDE